MTTVAFTEKGTAHAFNTKAGAHAALPPETWFVCDGPEELTRTLVPREWSQLCHRIGVSLTAREWRDLDEGSYHTQKSVMRGSAQRVWDALMTRAGDPPPPTEEENAAMAKEAAAAKEAPAAKDEGPRIPDGLNAKDKLRFGADKEGKPYAANKSPYREDSKRAERFALIRNGMTVKAALEAGLTGRQIKQMIEREHVVLDKAA